MVRSSDCSEAAIIGMTEDKGLMRFRDDFYSCPSNAVLCHRVDSQIVSVPRKQRTHPQRRLRRGTECVCIDLTEAVHGSKTDKGRLFTQCTVAF